MRRYTKHRIKVILKGGTKGQRKNLRFADLSNADLRFADLRKADLRKANLRKADLFNTDLSFADLCKANLRFANLCNANLRNANLREADSSKANLFKADLFNANLCNADLSFADLSNADLHNANLFNADLHNADLFNADLFNADLHNANLRYAKNIPEWVCSVTNILPGGDIYGYKKLNKGVIIKIRIPAKAKRSNATGRKCRCEYAYFDKVIDNPHKVKHFESGYNNIRYFKGKKMVPDSFDPDRWNECSNGIHFFITEWEARDYGL